MVKHKLREVVTYFRKSGALCISECAGTHARIIIGIILTFLFCEEVDKENGRLIISLYDREGQTMIDTNYEI